MKPPQLKIHEQFEIVKKLKKRHPDWEFNICPICNDWGLVFEQYAGMHPMCWTNHPTLRRRVLAERVDQLGFNEISDETSFDQTD